MRAWAFGAAMAGVLALAGAAEARTWTDPAGRFSFDAPAGWTVQQRRGATPADTFSHIIAGTANNECQFLAIDNATSAAASPDTVRAQSGEPARFTEAVWLSALNSIRNVFPNQSAQLVSQSIDTSGAWPIQRAEARSPERAVHAAMQLRPGVEIIVACMTFGGADPTELYDRVIRSVAHPNDAAWAAAAAAPAATPAATPAP